MGGPYLDAEAFFMSYLSAFVIILFFVGWKVWKREWSIGVSLRNADLDRGRRFKDVSRQSVISAIKARPWWKRLF